MDNKTEYLTIKDFAAAANVSTQRIYQRLAKDLQPYCKTENGKKYISIEGLKLFGKEDLQADLPNDTQGLANTLQEVAMLKTQLAEKDKQIDLLQSQVAELKADKDKLNARLDKAEEERERFETNISNLTAALTAAQALHGMDKQQAVIEVKADDAAAPESEPEIVPEEDQDKKLSFFARLFKRK